ncbi:MAG: hypothetical protein FWC89_02395 [Defluviitaleaceae bacterium]|nr:hypothetical protein [Defluviitaleaceae bacterium]
MSERDPRNSELNQRWSFFKMYYLDKNGDNYDKKLSENITKSLEQNSDLLNQTGLTEEQATAVATITGTALRSMIIGLITDYHKQVHGPQVVK